MSFYNTPGRKAASLHSFQEAKRRSMQAMEQSPRVSSTSVEHNYVMHGPVRSQNYAPPQFTTIDEGKWNSGQITDTPKPMIDRLIDTISANSIDSWQAARIMMDCQLHNVFNPDEYMLFLKHPKIAEIKWFDASAPIFPPEMHEDISHFIQLQVVQHKITLDITSVMFQKASVAITRCKNRLLSELDLKKIRDLPFSINFLDETLSITEDDIFKATDIKQMLTSGLFKTTKKSPLDKIYAVVKFILSQITKDPSAIKNYSVSFGEAPLRKHQELPHEVTSVLYEVIMQLTGLQARIYCEDPDIAQLDYSHHWDSLGADGNERLRRFLRLKELKDSLMDARPNIVAHQLNELRRCSLGEEGLKSAMPNRKKKKLENSESNDA